jgi:Spy/CpxP family protein refolding chaperone
MALVTEIQKKDMKTIKLGLVFLVAAGLFASSLSMHAQTNTPPGDQSARVTAGANSLLAALEKSLGTTNKLSDEQKLKVRAVFEDQIKQMASLSREELKAKLGATIAEAQNKMKVILTPDQFKIYWDIFQPAPARSGGSGSVTPSQNK